MLGRPGGKNPGGRSVFTPSSALSVLLVVLLGLQTLLVAYYRNLYISSTYPVSGSSALQGATAGNSRQLGTGGSSSGSSQASGSKDRSVAWHLLADDAKRARLDQLERTPDGSAYLRSSGFAPLRISVCTHRMPQHFAPCLKLPGVDIEHAEEVMYPAHKVRVPGFGSTDDRHRWENVIHSRGLVIKEDKRNVAFHVSGQNFVFRNTRYTNNPHPDDWSSANTHCLGWNGMVKQFQSVPQPDEKDRVHEELFLLNTPQGFSYQHFSDHAFKVVMQGMHLLSNNTDTVACRAGVSTIAEIASWFSPINPARILWGKSPSHYAKRLIHSCRVPFWHPYMVQRWQEMALGPDAAVVPMSQRKVVMYYSRSMKDDMRHNGGREVLNEKELLEQLRALLVRRNQNETLVMLDLKAFKSYKEFAQYINANVRALIGPHGGGLINCIWAAANTLMVEFQHYNHINYAMWELSPLLNQNYHMMSFPPKRGTDFDVNVASVVKLVETQLGHEEPLGTYVSHDYDWAQALING